MNKIQNTGTNGMVPGTRYLHTDREKSLVYVMYRSAWGYHPHGVDDVCLLLNFHWNDWK